MPWIAPEPDAPAGAAPALPAASILLLRDGPAGLEVLTVMRSREMRFAGGMLAFPGGRVDRADASPRLTLRLRPRRALPVIERAARLAAIRELFEEAGILLACDARTGRRIREPRRRRLARRWRVPLLADRVTLATLAERADLVFDPGALVFFAHWVTPVESPRRFDARFYLARAPEDQQAELENEIENTALAWRRPQDILADWQAGRQPLMFPTRLNLVKLARARSVAEALAQARATPVHRLRPEIVGPRGEGRRLVIPHDAGFGITEARPDELDPLEGQFVARIPLLGEGGRMGRGG